MNGKKFLIGHCDALGPGDHGYKFIKSVFRNSFAQWLYARFHPNFGLGLAEYFSRKGYDKKETERGYTGDDKEFLVRYCNDVIRSKHYDYFVFGHRHLPLLKPIGDHSIYINLGDWIQYNTYAVFDGTTCELKKFEG